MRPILRSFPLVLTLGALALSALLLAPLPARAQMPMPAPLIVVNVGNDVGRAGLSLTRFGVAEVGDEYTVGATFSMRGRKMPGQVALRIVTASGRTLQMTSPLRRVPLGSCGFLVMVGKDEGPLKMVTIKLR